MAGGATGQRALAGGLTFGDVASGLSVQFTDNFLKLPDWRERLDKIVPLGAKVVRVDFNWTWIEKVPGLFDWRLYDALGLELEKRGLRPLFILNRANPLHGKILMRREGTRSVVDAEPPATEQDVAAFARFAAAGAARFAELNPIWEIWNEPDDDGSWQPRPDPRRYVQLALATCKAIKEKVPRAVVVGPAASQIPTVWRKEKPLMAALLAEPALLSCLDAVSVHTHRFRQVPETVSRDYDVLRANYLSVWPAGIARKPLIDTEWGDSVFDAGISEQTQALWLARMFVINLMEQVPLTNWYCLMDVGQNAGDREHRFGLLRSDGSARPAYAADRVMAVEIGGMVPREVLARFDAQSATGASALLLCSADGRCKVAAWTTRDEGETIRLRGLRLVGPAADYLGQKLDAAHETAEGLEIALTPAMAYVPVAYRGW